MRRQSAAAMKEWSFVLALGLVLAGCAAADTRIASDANPEAKAAPGSPGTLPAAGGVVRRGSSFAMMAEQYGPRDGPYAATGASAWVRPAPAPAFVASGPPPAADAPAPPPPPVTRPEAAGPAVSDAAAPDPELRSAGLALFNSLSCGVCHALADAGAAGGIGPSLDANPRLTPQFTADVIASGSGAMPSFAGQLSDAEIETLAAYIVQFARP